jgi:hypothetical protein
MSDTNNPNSKVNPQDELRDLIQILPQEMCGEEHLPFDMVQPISED